MAPLMALSFRRFERGLLPVLTSGRLNPSLRKRAYALASMNLIEQIDKHEYLYLTEIGEPDVNVLRIVIEEAQTSRDETRTLQFGSRKISDLRPIVSGDTCLRYEIVFGSYVSYCVRNESYVVLDQSEVFTGRLFNIYSRSHFLDYVRAATIASEDYPGKFIHYGINCLDHILDVVSVDEPAINLLRRG